MSCVSLFLLPLAIFIKTQSRNVREMRKTRLRAEILLILYEKYVQGSETFATFSPSTCNTSLNKTTGYNRKKHRIIT